MPHAGGKHIRQQVQAVFATKQDYRKTALRAVENTLPTSPRHIVGMMKKKQDRIELARKIISSVEGEMQRPRLAQSVRDDPEYQVLLAAEVRLAERLNRAGRR
jgi:hypothetical protein